MRRAFTLLELLIAVTIMAVVTVGCVEILGTAIGYNEHLRTGRSKDFNRQAFEDKMTEMIHHIYIDPVNNSSATTFFVGQTGNGMPPGQSVVPGAPISGATAGGGAGTTGGGQVSAPTTSGSNTGDADTLMFTMLGRRPAAALLASTDDFETNNTNFGPQGGISEISISTNPVGTPTNGQTGVIYREQVPADQDATQGGYEQVIEPDVSKISFEFFDGTQWQSSWNTFGQTTRQLPNAVRVDYTVTGDPTDHIFVVGVLNSNVTPLSPATMTGGG